MNIIASFCTIRGNGNTSSIFANFSGFDSMICQMQLLILFRDIQIQQTYNSDSVAPLTLEYSHGLA